MLIQTKNKWVLFVISVVLLQGGGGGGGGGDTTSTNSAPVASDVVITDTVTVGSTLTGIYIYADADEDTEGASTYQ